MRAVLSLNLLVMFAVTLSAQQVRGHYGEEPQILKGEIHAIVDPVPLRSFKQLCERADAIVEGVVETDATRRMPGPGVHIETDFWIAVGRVVKGSVATPKIVVSEMGGTFGELHLITNLPLLERGERYVLFLYEDKRPGVPPVPGLARFEADTFYGTFKLDAGKIQPFSREHFGGQYTGLTLDAFAREIATTLKP